jgi:hypothetical protein
LSDATQPDSTLSCKCSVMKEHKKLQLYKASFSLKSKHIAVLG